LSGRIEKNFSETLKRKRSYKEAIDMEARLAVMASNICDMIWTKDASEGIIILLPCKIIGGDFHVNGMVSMIKISFYIEGEMNECWVNPEYIFVNVSGGYDLSNIPGGQNGMDSIMFAPQLKDVRDMYDTERKILSSLPEDLI